jgi:hypothetical protein
VEPGVLEVVVSDAVSVRKPAAAAAAVGGGGGGGRWEKEQAREKNGWW